LRWPPEQPSFGLILKYQAMDVNGAVDCFHGPINAAIRMPRNCATTPDDWHINKQFQMIRFDGERRVFFGPIVTDEYKTN
jgi:hypothetical protein